MPNCTELTAHSCPLPAVACLGASIFFLLELVNLCLFLETASVAPCLLNSLTTLLRSAGRSPSSLILEHLDASLSQQRSGQRGAMWETVEQSREQGMAPAWTWGQGSGRLGGHLGCIVRRKECWKQTRRPVVRESQAGPQAQSSASAFHNLITSVSPLKSQRSSPQLWGH